MMTLLAAPASAQITGGAKHLRIEPVVATNGPSGGYDLALVTTPEAGWHGYWGENPGDAGFPPKLEWTAPPGTRFGPWRWPVPATLKIAGLMNYVYDRPFAPMTTVQLPAGRAGVEQVLTLHLSYLVCTDSICVPEDQTVSVRLTAGAASSTLDRWRATLPRAVGSTATYQADAKGVRIAVPFPAGAALVDPYFFPNTTGAIDYAATQTVTRDGDRLVIATTGKPTGVIEGVLRVGPEQGLRLRAVPGAVPGARAGAESWVARALAAFGLAVLGGLILNIMPCVFPILSLKALSLARSGGEGARGEALAYTGGVVMVCVGLGAVILLLRAGGAATGWAFQLTDPRMVLLLLVLAAGILIGSA